MQFQHVPGQLVNLLRVAVEDSLDVGIRQVAVITFKNAVKKDWDPLGAPSTPMLHTFLIDTILVNLACPLSFRAELCQLHSCIPRLHHHARCPTWLTHPS